MRLAPPALIVFVAVATALFVVWPAPIDPTALVGHYGHPDMLSNHWLLVWVAEQVSAGGDLLHNTRYYAPDGDYPLLAGNGTEGFLYLPFHLLLPWPISASVYVTALLVANILAGTWAAHRLGAIPSASVLAGVAYGTSPYIVQELGSGRFTQADGIFLALALGWGFGVLRRLELGEPNSWTCGITGGLLFGATCIFYWFYGYFVVLSAALVLLVMSVRLRAVPWRIVPAFLLTATAMLIGPLAWYLTHWSRIPGTDESTVFPHPEAVGDALSITLPVRVPGAHQGAAISLVVLGLLACGLWLWRTRGSARDRNTLASLALLMATGWALARGPALWFGAPFTPFEFVYGWAEPLQRFWWPSRHLILVHWAAAMLAARALSSLLSSRPHAWLSGAAAALAIPATLWLTGDLARAPVTTYQPPDVYLQLSSLPEGGLLEVPLSPRLGGNQQMLVHQLLHQRQLFSGHAVWVDRVRPSDWTERLQTNGLLASWIAFEEGSTNPPSFIPSDVDALREAGIRWIVHNRAYVPSGMHQAVDRALRDLFGNPVLKTRLAKVYDMEQYAGATRFRAPPFQLDPEARYGNGTRPFTGRKPTSPALEILRDTRIPFQGLTPQPPRAP